MNTSYMVGSKVYTIYVIAKKLLADVSLYANTSLQI
jgi:hypothetical protein